MQIDATALDDAAGLSYAGINDTTSLSFRSKDESNPSLISSTPSHNSTTLATNGNLVLNFSEEIDSETGTIVIYKASDDSVFESFDVATSTRITGSGTSIITIEPTNDFEESTSYYLLFLMKLLMMFTVHLLVKESISQHSYLLPQMRLHQP